MTWTNLTGTNIAFEIRSIYGSKGRVMGPYRFRANAERAFESLPDQHWEIVETTSDVRCDDEHHETTEAEWCK